MRTALKRGLAVGTSRRPAPGCNILIYHRVGGGTPDERDVGTASFAEQVALLTDHRVVDLDTALDELEAGDDRPKIVLTFDDGFADVHTTALPLLEAHGLPFTVYLSTAYIGGCMHWEGSTASAPGPALRWDQVEALAASPLCTLGNHTHRHVRPAQLSEEELDRCSDELERRVGVTPRHFAYTWGVPVPAMEPALRVRFRSASTGRVGRNLPGGDLMRLARIPVRRTDPPSFFAAKLAGRLLPDRIYGGVVRTAKALRAQR